MVVTGEVTSISWRAPENGRGTGSYVFQVGGEWRQTHSVKWDAVRAGDTVSFSIGAVGNITLKSHAATSPMHAIEAVVTDLISTRQTLKLVEDCLAGKMAHAFGDATPEATERWTARATELRMTLSAFQVQLRTLDPTHKELGGRNDTEQDDCFHDIRNRHGVR